MVCRGGHRGRVLGLPHFLGRLEVISVPGKTPGLEERLGSAYQRMPIWELSLYRAFLPKPPVRRPR